MKSTFTKVLKICALSIFAINFILIAILQIRLFTSKFDVFNDQIYIVISKIIYFATVPLLFLFGISSIIFEYVYKYAMEGLNSKNIAKIICFLTFVILFSLATIIWFIFCYRLFNFTIPY